MTDREQTRPLTDAEPIQVLIRAALKAITPCGKALREQGWDATVAVHAAEADQDHVADVTLQIRLGYAMQIPVETR